MKASAAVAAVGADAAAPELAWLLLLPPLGSSLELTTRQCCRTALLLQLPRRRACKRMRPVPLLLRTCVWLLPAGRRCLLSDGPADMCGFSYAAAIIGILLCITQLFALVSEPPKYDTRGSSTAQSVSGQAALPCCSAPHCPASHSQLENSNPGPYAMFRKHILQLLKPTHRGDERDVPGRRASFSPTHLHRQCRPIWMTGLAAALAASFWLGYAITATGGRSYCKTFCRLCAGSAGTAASMGNAAAAACLQPTLVCLPTHLQCMLPQLTTLPAAAFASLCALLAGLPTSATPCPSCWWWLHTGAHVQAGCVWRWHCLLAVPAALLAFTVMAGCKACLGMPAEATLPGCRPHGMLCALCCRSGWKHEALSESVDYMIPTAIAFKERQAAAEAAKHAALPQGALARMSAAAVAALQRMSGGTGPAALGRTSMGAAPPVTVARTSVGAAPALGRSSVTSVASEILARPSMGPQPAVSSTEGAASSAARPPPTVERV